MTYVRRRQVAAVALGVIVLAQLVGCVPEPTAGATDPPTPSASASASPSSPTPTTSATAQPSPSSTQTPEPPPDLEQADVVIITADLQSDGLEVTGMVTGRTDPAGVCTLEASFGGVTRTAEAIANPTGGNSYCPLLVIPSGDLATGAWQVTLRYSATGVGGTSSPVTVEVP